MRAACGRGSPSRDFSGAVQYIRHVSFLCHGASGVKLYPGLRTRMIVARCAWCAVISLVDAPVCVASGFPIATGKHIRDCDLVPSTSASCTPALEADEVRSTTSIQS